MIGEFVFIFIENAFSLVRPDPHVCECLLFSKIPVRGKNGINNHWISLKLIWNGWKLQVSTSADSAAAGGSPHLFP